MTGALSGITIVEFAGIGPGPFCGMMLADHGARVIRIDRPGSQLDRRDPLVRNRESIKLDMKMPEGMAVARDLCRQADGLIEGFRPGVMERLGLGPDVLLGDNAKLVYGRMTGWGQTGPWAQAAGHDINYIALAGVLHGIGERGRKPVPPANYIGDFGGGAMMLAFGMVSALLNVKMGGSGQVLDAAMTDGAALIAAMTWYFHATGIHHDMPGVNRLDGGAHYYGTYECADGKWIAIGSIEPQFYALLRDKAGLTDPAFDNQNDQSQWLPLKDKLAAVFRERTRDEWCTVMDATDVCFAPVLSLREAPEHPHNRARGTFVAVAGACQPAPAPRFSQTTAPHPREAPVVGADTDTILGRLGYDGDRIANIRGLGVLG